VFQFIRLTSRWRRRSRLLKQRSFRGHVLKCGKRERTSPYSERAPRTMGGRSENKSPHASLSRVRGSLCFLVKFPAALSFPILVQEARKRMDEHRSREVARCSRADWQELITLVA
jgi:hypothetical protein